MAFAGLRGTGDWATGQEPQNFREMILWRNPNGIAPMFALMSQVKKEPTDSATFNWWDESVDLVRLQVNKSGGYGTTDTLIDVDSSDPSTSSPDNHYGSALNLVPGDILMVEPSADAATFTPENLIVTAVHSATQFSVKRGYAGTTAASIADNAFLVKISTAFSEGTDAPQSSSRNPTLYTNYTQIFKTAYEVTRTAANTRLRTGPELQNEKLRKSSDHSKSLELAFMFGQKFEGTGDNGKPIRTTNGLRAQIAAASTTILATNWSVANAATAGNDFMSAMEKVFNFESRAGDERVIFAGNAALNALNNAIHKGTNIGATTINFQGMEKVYGMRFQRVVLPQGTVFIKTHPLLSRHPLYKNSMFVLDFSAIRYRPLSGGDTKPMDNIQGKGEDLIRGQWMTEAGVEVQNAGLTCGYIGGFNAAIA